MLPLIIYSGCVAESSDNGLVIADDDFLFLFFSKFFF